MNPVPNQPLLFRETGTFDTESCEDVSYQARMFETDVLRWQFEIDTCPNAAQLIDEPFFNNVGTWTTNDNATVFGGSINLCAFSIGGQLVQANVPDVVGQWYEFSIVVGAVAENIGRSRFRVSSLFEAIEFPATTGRHTFYVQATAFNILVISLLGDVSLNEPGLGLADITEVTMKEINYPSCQILDLNDNVLQSPSPTFATGKSATWEFVPDTAEIDARQIKVRVFRSCLGDDSDLEDFTSESICIIPENNRDLLIGGCGNTNSFLEDFDPVLRIQGEIVRGTSYQMPNRYTYQNSKGRFFNGHTRRNKVSTLKIELCPEHVRDFIYMLPLFNTVGIRVGTGRQEQYFIEEEPDEPIFADGEKSLAAITMQLVRKSFNEVSTFEKDCEPSLPPVVIGDRNLNEAIQTGNNPAEDELIKA
jgi:hypothetical protein